MSDLVHELVRASAERDPDSSALGARSALLDYGELEARVQERVDRGVLFIPFHFWEAAAKQGRKTLLFKFPGTWPIRLKEGEGIQIGGAAGFGGLRSYLDVWHAHCFTNDPAGKKGATLSTPRPAQGWRDIPVSEAEALECDLSIELNHHRGTLTLYGLIYRSDSGEGYDRLMICISEHIIALTSRVIFCFFAFI